MSSAASSSSSSSVAFQSSRRSIFTSTGTQGILESHGVTGETLTNSHHRHGHTGATAETSGPFVLLNHVQLLAASGARLLLWDLTDASLTSSRVILRTFDLGRPILWMANVTGSSSRVYVIREAAVAVGEPTTLRTDASDLLSGRSVKKRHRKSHASSFSSHSAPLSRDRPAQWELVVFDLNSQHITVLVSANSHPSTPHTQGHDSLATRVPFVAADCVARPSTVTTHVSSSTSSYDTIAMVAGRHLAVWKGDGTILSWDSDDNSKDSKEALNSTLMSHRHVRAYTCVSVHPTSRHTNVATGDDKGQVFLYTRGLDPTEDQTHQATRTTTTTDPAHLSFTKYHWHASAVGAVTYSQDGSYLLSGGNEAVLVLWELESGRRLHVPRLPAVITALCRNALEVGTVIVMYDDASVSLVDPVAQVVRWTHRRVAMTPSPKSLLPTTTTFVTTHSHSLSCPPLDCHRQLLATSRGMVLDPKSGALVINGPVLSTPSLQFIHPLTQTLLTHVEISHRNMIAKTEVSEVMPLAYISFVAFNAKGTRMATVETGGVSLSPLVLKFWHMNDLKVWECVAQVDAPHGHAITSLTALEYHPTLERVITASAEGMFKTWEGIWTPPSATTLSQLVSSRSTPSTSSPSLVLVWQCLAVVTYLPLPIHAVAYSPDGSVLAVTYGHVITLWHSAVSLVTTSTSRAKPSTLSNLTLLSTLCDDKAQQYQSLLFLPDATVPHLVATSTSGSVYCWNVLTRQLVWHERRRSLTMTKSRDTFAPSHLPLLASQSSSRASSATVSDGRALLVIAIPESDTNDKSNSTASLIVYRDGSDPSSRLSHRPVITLLGDQTTITAMSFQQDGSLLLMTSDCQLQVMSYATLVDQDMSTTVCRSDCAETFPVTLTSKSDVDMSFTSQFHAMFNPLNVEGVDTLTTKDSQTRVSVKAFSSLSAVHTSGLFDAPAHLLPRLSSLFQPFMASLMTHSNHNLSSALGPSSSSTSLPVDENQRLHPTQTPSALKRPRTKDTRSTLMTMSPMVDVDVGAGETFDAWAACFSTSVVAGQ